MAHPAHIRATARRARAATLATALVAVAAAFVLATVAASPANAGDRFRYEIVNATGLKADVMWASTARYTGVFLWPDNSSASQEYDLLDSGDGYFRIRARHSGQCLMLDPRGSTYTNGTRIVQSRTCTAGYAPGEWRVRTLSGTRCSDGVCTTGTDRRLLVNRRTNRCLDADAPNGRPRTKAILQQWTCVTSTSAWNIANQSWDLVPSGSVRID